MSAPPIKAGARVRKVMGDPGDIHALGAAGEVIAAIGPLPAGTVIRGEDCSGEYGYLVAFDGEPEAMTFVRGKKLEAI